MNFEDFLTTRYGKSKAVGSFFREVLNSNIKDHLEMIIVFCEKGILKYILLGLNHHLRYGTATCENVSWNIGIKSLAIVFGGSLRERAQKGILWKRNLWEARMKLIRISSTYKHSECGIANIPREHSSSWHKNSIKMYAQSFPKKLFKIGLKLPLFRSKLPIKHASALFTDNERERWVQPKNTSV